MRHIVLVNEIISNVTVHRNGFATSQHVGFRRCGIHHLYLSARILLRQLRNTLGISNLIDILQGAVQFLADNIVLRAGILQHIHGLLIALYLQDQTVLQSYIRPFTILFRHLNGSSQVLHLLSSIGTSCRHRFVEVQITWQTWRILGSIQTHLCYR